MTSATGEPGALDGLRVLDLTRILAGPLCTMTLGDMGADVIKVEPPGTGDDTRMWGPPFAAKESAYFLGINRNKRSITLNMAVKPGQEILAKLIAQCDVVVENFKLGTLEKWGFDNDWLQTHAPRVIRCSITGYGSSGPKAGLPGYDFILQAESGLMSICGEPEGEPMKYGVAIVDICTGMLACNAVLAALQARHRTGKGQQVEVSLFDSSLAMLANVASNHLVSGRDARRFGNGHPNIVPYTAYSVSDGMIAVAVGNDAQFARFAALLGKPEWAADPRYAKNPDRVGHRDTLDPAISDALRQGSAESWLAKLTQAGIPCGRINSVAQALNDEHAVAREMVLSVQHPTAGEVKMLGIPFRFSDTPASVRRAPPTLGQHTEQVLRDMLQLSDARIAELRSASVI
ncbi:MAG TPA: CoA transferase [Burkholderiales bacterium]|jgi:crotonobetainyl-CoA:carnitine CoA-transferase CaiB-like acyl-CoA transferase|nr:CoA transferase [Burkholderiales bacterium]